MGRRPAVGIRYCGGCNPRYDRVALAGELARALPEVDFPPAEAGQSYDAAVVVCGCTARCAGVRELAVLPERLLYVTAPEELERCRRRLAMLLGESLPRHEN